MLKKLHHIGILLEDFDGKVKRFEKFGLACSKVIEKKEEALQIAFFPIGDTLIEFISYTTNKSDDLSQLIRSQQGQLNHLCFEVDDIEATIQDFEKNGAKLIEGSLRVGVTGRIAFFHPETTDGILIELTEP
jgi:methylmalonyl-CoA epimerase